MVFDPGKVVLGHFGGVVFIAKVARIATLSYRIGFYTFVDRAGADCR